MDRLGVGIMLINEKGHIFVGQRRDFTSAAWQMPQGGIDAGESPEEAALRELQEETGVTTVRILAKATNWYRYDLPRKLQKKLWDGQYHGQAQQWFLMRFLGHEDTINIHTQHPEFQHWRWIEPAQLVALIVPFKRALYREILAEFLPFIMLEINGSGGGI